MPKYTFACPRCGLTVQSYSQLHDTVLCEKCNVDMKLKMPVLAGQDVKETVDKHTNTQWRQDQKETILERKADYFWEVEVPRLVNSGTYSLKTMLENGWVYYDDKNQLQTRTKPPQKQ